MEKIKARNKERIMRAKQSMRMSKLVLDPDTHETIMKCMAISSNEESTSSQSNSDVEE